MFIASLSTLLPGHLIYLFQGEIWSHPSSGPKILDELERELEPATLSTIYQVIDNPEGELTKLTKVIQNPAYPTYATLSTVDTNLVFSGNVLGVNFLKRLVASQKIPEPHVPFRAFDSSTISQSMQASVRPPLTASLDWTNQSLLANATSHPLGNQPSVPNLLHMEMQTSSSMKARNELTLIKRTLLYKTTAQTLVLGAGLDPHDTDVGLAIRYRLP